MAIIQGTSKASSGSYQIDQSIRFNDDDSAYMYRTPGTNANGGVWTFSGWVKRGLLGTGQVLLSDGATAFTTGVGFTVASNLYVSIGNQSSASTTVTTAAVFRDPSAWYHIVVAVYTSDATSSDRVKVWMNGVRQTLTGTYPSTAFGGGFSTSFPWRLGDNSSASHAYYDGYMAEINFIDGQALVPTDFGEYNDDGVWIPKAYAGTYGTNGFYITGEDSADLGADYSGNGNNFTSSGLTSDDQVTDTPTDNYAVLNPIDVGTTYKPTFSDGNLKYTAVTGTQNPARTSIAVSSGKWYFETTCNGRYYLPWVGIMSAVSSLGTGDNFQSYWGQPAAWGTLNSTGVGRVYSNGVLNTSYSTAFAVSDVVMVAFDVDAGKCWFGKNGTWNDSGNPAAGTSESAYFTYTDPVTVFLDGTYSGGADAWTLNFGQSGLTYTPPTGFKALSTANLPAPAIKDGSAYFQTTLYSGNSSTQEINQSGNSTMQPDLVWIKERNRTNSHVITDAVRGVNSQLSSNESNAEGTATDAVTTFDSDGFSLGDGSELSLGATNTTGYTYAAWQWLAGNGTASNTDGSITSTVSANTTAGISISTYTGTAATATIGHGLGVAPAMIIVKKRNAAERWTVFHRDTSNAYIYLNETFAAETGNAAYRFGNDSAVIQPTSTVFTVGTSNDVNSNSNQYVAYCFAEVEGFSKFGSYTGGSADGPFVWCGFKPAFVMVKRTDSTSQWSIFDSQREGYNVDNDVLVPNTTAAETTTDYFDLLSNGFKARTTDANVNASGGTYIYMAFAEHPFGGSGVAPVPAR